MEQLDAEFTKWLVTLGVGGVLAGFMFAFYRKDIKQYTELWRLTADSMMVIIKENTASNTKLIALIESQERNSIRKNDIETLTTYLRDRAREIDRSIQGVPGGGGGQITR